MITLEIAKRKDRFLREAVKFLSAEPPVDDTASSIARSAHTQSR